MHQKCKINIGTNDAQADLLGRNNSGSMLVMLVSPLYTKAKSQWRHDSRIPAIVGFALVLTALIPINLAIQFWTGISTLKPLQLWLMANHLDTADSWLPMRAALDWVRAAPDGSLYHEIFFDRHLKFQYAPTSLLPLAGLDAIGLGTDPVFLNRISRLLLLLSAAGIGALTWILLPGRTHNDAMTRGSAALVVGCATFLFFPITYGYQLGQLQVWNNAIFVFACLAWVLDKRIAAGVLIGMICLFKPQLSIFALWGLLRREWGFFLGLTITGAAGLVASVFLFGLQNNIGYLEVLSYISRHGEAHLSNHSVNGLLHRLVGDDDGLIWRNDAFSPYHPVVYAGTLVTTAAILLIGLWPRGRLTGLNGLLQFQLAALAFTMASPLAWEPHYGVLAPIFATLFCFVLAMPDRRTRGLWLRGLAITFVVSANHWAFVGLFAHTPLLVLQSYLLFAGLGVMAMLWRATRISSIHEGMAPIQS
jgi:alpha-1,2-mannosyltransferase